MTMDRAFLTAALAAGLAHSDSIDEAGVCVIVWGLLWLMTSDPLPAAIERGLEAFRRRYQR